MIGTDPLPMTRSIRILRLLTPPRRSVARLGVFALLLHASLLGIHQPPGPLVAIAGEATERCSDHHSAGISDPQGGEPDRSSPAHAGARCPFCTLVEGGKLLPPSPCLIFPPASAPGAMVPPSLEATPSAALIAAHRPRGPPSGS